MILTLDIGNSQIYGGLFDESSKENNLKFQFRRESRTGSSSDEFGIFLKTVLQENGFDPSKIRQISICSVVPDALHSIRGACKKYFNIQPFIVQSGTKTGLKIKYRNPLEVGADRIANAIAAIQMYPGKNLIIVDFGTATTFCAITAEKEYLGGLIFPGLRISMEALEHRTAKLPSVEIVKPDELVGRSTVEGIQSGLFYWNLYALKGIAQQIKKDYFKDQGAVLIGTGGFSRLFENENVFDALIPDLVLHGLYTALKINT